MLIPVHLCLRQTVPLHVSDGTVHHAQEMPSCMISLPQRQIRADIPNHKMTETILGFFSHHVGNPRLMQRLRPEAAFQIRPADHGALCKLSRPAFFPKQVCNCLSQHILRFRTKDLKPRSILMCGTDLFGNAAFDFPRSRSPPPAHRGSRHFPRPAFLTLMNCTALKEAKETKPSSFKTVSCLTLVTVMRE